MHMFLPKIQRYDMIMCDATERHDLQLGSLSHALNQRCARYEDLPPWTEVRYLWLNEKVVVDVLETRWRSPTHVENLKTHRLFKR